MVRAYRTAWKEAGRAREPRVSVSRSIFALIDDRDRAYFGRGREDDDQIGFIDERTRAIFGRSYAAEPDVLIEQLRKDEAITEADTLLPPAGDKYTISGIHRTSMKLSSIGIWKSQSGGCSAAQTPEVLRFSHIVERAKAGLLNDWLRCSKGRLSLIIVLDQFTRGLFGGTPEAFSSDTVALQIAESGFRNGHYASLSKMWERSFFCLPLIHTEGENHTARIQRVIDLSMIERNANPPHLLPIFDRGIELAKQRLETVQRFGRFPHRNVVLGRESTRDEIEFLERG